MDDIKNKIRYIKWSRLSEQEKFLYDLFKKLVTVHSENEISYYLNGEKLCAMLNGDFQIGFKVWFKYMDDKSLKKYVKRTAYDVLGINVNAVLYCLGFFDPD